MYTVSEVEMSPILLLYQWEETYYSKDTEYFIPIFRIPWDQYSIFMNRQEKKGAPAKHARWKIRNKNHIDSKYSPSPKETDKDNLSADLP